MKNPIAFLIVKQWDFLQKYILLPIWVVQTVDKALLLQGFAIVGTAFLI